MLIAKITLIPFGKEQSLDHAQSHKAVSVTQIITPLVGLLSESSTKFYAFYAWSMSSSNADCSLLYNNGQSWQ